MHIILTEENAKLMEEKYIVLELDLIKIAPDQDSVPAFCVISFEDVALEEIPQLEKWKRLHQKLIENYRKRNWDFCEQALEHLPGRWKGTVDSFYREISERIAKYKTQDLSDDWDYTIHKY